MYRTTYGRTMLQRFDSVDELLADVRDLPESRFGGQCDVDRLGFIGRKFRFWTEVDEAAQTAWDDGLEIVDRMLGDLADASLPRPTSRRRRTRFAEDDGNELDYDRLRSGQPFWRTSRRENTRGPATITIIVDVTAHCGVRHKDILWRGAAAIALTKLLEAAGYRVELWAVGVSQDTWRRSTTDTPNEFTAVCLKRPGDPLDISTLVSGVSGWFFRTVFFRAKYLGREKVKMGLGTPRKPTPKDLDHITTDANRVLISGAFDYDAAVSKVRAALQTLTERS